MLIGLTYDLRQDYLDAGYGEEETAEFDKPDTIEGIETALRELGFETDRVGNGRALAGRLVKGDRWDLIFNICEGMHGIAREAQVPALLDLYEIPYTFSDPVVLGLTLHKGMTNHVVRDLGLRVADFRVVEPGEEAALAAIDMPWPLFVKPVAEGTGKGVTAASKVASREALATACRGVWAQFHQAALVEEFLPGREFTVAIAGTGHKAWAIGAMEVILGETAEAEVYSYFNKENFVGRVTYRLVDEAAKDDALGRAAIELAVAAWRGLGCRDAGRIDIRADAAGHPAFMEVNPLAGINPTISDMPIICRMKGIPYRQLIAWIMESALERIGQPMPTPKS
jgi:D-alanine-D-alanine ligase